MSSAQDLTARYTVDEICITITFQVFEDRNFVFYFENPYNVQFTSKTYRCCVFICLRMILVTFNNSGAKKFNDFFVLRRNSDGGANHVDYSLIPR